jgi:predicted nucleic acid-binding protein
MVEIMENEEILQILSKIDKKQDKILKLVTMVAKTLHIVPVSEKEEREIQVLQRKNAAVMQKIQEEIANLETETEKVEDTLNMHSLFEASQAEVYADIIGDDFITDVKED